MRRTAFGRVEAKPPRRRAIPTDYVQLRVRKQFAPQDFSVVELTQRVSLSASQ